MIVASPVSVGCRFGFASTSMIGYGCRTISSGDNRGDDGLNMISGCVH